MLQMPSQLVESIKIDKISKFGDPKKSPRNLCVQFNSQKEKDEVRYHGANPTGTGYSMFEQFPPEIVDQRRKLVKIMKEKKLNEPSSKIKLVYNKLYVKGELYQT
ncbi:hypothetical protein SNE40_013162 [Patella caerulea]|uniref:Uncharacterized protein n=1 Tax=Patella caerulea TaxID=87958 RepID=A0AAN8JHL2_PATCE